MLAGGNPDMIIDGYGKSIVSQPLTDGDWYFHIRVRDKAGNWNDSAYNIGPFKIDTGKPTNPVAISTTHAVAVRMNNSQISVNWNASPGADATSGLAGYSFVWDTSPSTIPDEISEGQVLATISPALTDGSAYWFHIRTVDKAGNWNASAFPLGPFWIDTTPPSGNFKINGGASYSNSGLAGLTFTFSHLAGIKEILVSASKDFRDGIQWRNESTMQWDISKGDASGARTVWVRVTSGSGTILETSQSINLVSKYAGIKVHTPASTEANVARISGSLSAGTGAAAPVRIWIDNTEVVRAPDGNFSGIVELQPGTNRIKVVAEDEAGNVYEKTVTISRAENAVFWASSNLVPWLDLLLLLMVAAVASYALYRTRRRPGQKTDVMGQSAAAALEVSSANCPTCGTALLSEGGCPACSLRFEGEELLVRALQADLEVEDRARFALSVSSAVRTLSEGQVEEGKQRLQQVRGELDRLETRQADKQHGGPISSEAHSYPLGKIPAPEDWTGGPVPVLTGQVVQDEVLPEAELLMDETGAIPKGTVLEAVPVRTPQIHPRAPEKEPPVGLLLFGDREGLNAARLIGGPGTHGANLLGDRVETEKIRAVATELLGETVHQGGIPLLIAIGQGDFGGNQPTIIVEDIGAMGARGAYGGPDISSSVLPLSSNAWRAIGGIKGTEGLRIVSSEEVGVWAVRAPDLLNELAKVHQQYRGSPGIRVIGLWANKPSYKQELLSSVIKSLRTVQGT
jgi:uncharacterized Zn finger protein (UPF0148 family)